METQASGALTLRCPSELLDCTSREPINEKQSLDSRGRWLMRTESNISLEIWQIDRANEDEFTSNNNMNRKSRGLING